MKLRLWTCTPFSCFFEKSCSIIVVTLLHDIPLYSCMLEADLLQSFSSYPLC